MNHLYNIFIAGLLPLAIAGSVFIHDCKIDKATIYKIKSATGQKITKKGKKVAMTAREAALYHDPHVHPEKAHKNLLNGFAHPTPSVAPRIVRMKKSLQKSLKTPSRHAFDDELLPVLA